MYLQSELKPAAGVELRLSRSKVREARAQVRANGVSAREIRL
jgi:hypothetical protein